MNDNILRVVFRGPRRIKSTPLYQYDYGQILKISGIELPFAYEVHFSNSEIGTAKTRVGDGQGVTIPDEYLLTGETIYAWLFLHTGENDGETKYTIEIPVIRRAKATDAPPTPVQQDTITELIAALDAGVDAAEAAADKIENMNVNAVSLPYTDDATASWDGETGTLTLGIPRGRPGSGGGGGGGTAEVYVTPIENGIRVDAIDDEHGRTGGTVYNGTNGKDGKDGKDGQNGQDGQDGADGFSPTVTPSAITGGHRLTIVDKNGTSTVDIMDGVDGHDGTNGRDGTDGTDGADGFSPLVTVTQNASNAVISVTDATGTTTATLTSAGYTIRTIHVPSGGSLSQVLDSGTEYRFDTNDITILSISAPMATMPDDFVAWIVLPGYTVAPSLVYPNTIKWTGDDVSNNVFVPAANTTYNIALWYDGTNLNGVVRGV